MRQARLSKSSTGAGVRAAAGAAAATGAGAAVVGTGAGAAAVRAGGYVTARIPATCVPAGKQSSSVDMIGPVAQAAGSFSCGHGSIARLRTPLPQVAQYRADDVGIVVGPHTLVWIA